MVGQYQPLSTYHVPPAPIFTVPIPNLPISVAEKALESLSRPPPFEGGNEKCTLFCSRLQQISKNRIETTNVAYPGT
jgi:hypothetical protein